MSRILIAFILASGCTPRVARNASTYTAEIVSSLARQEAAAAALRDAATAAREAGDTAACLSYIEPAIRIEVRAAAEAKRALWLAGLPYPEEPASDPKAKQPDPGEAPMVDSSAFTAFCEEK